MWTQLIRAQLQAPDESAAKLLPAALMTVSDAAANTAFGLNDFLTFPVAPPMSVFSLLSKVCSLSDQDHPLDQVQDEHERRRRQEEEFQARYRSDPNLARYPVKPQPSEETMRMLAQVGRVRHQRRHSDVSLAAAEPDHLTQRYVGRRIPDR